MPDPRRRFGAGRAQSFPAMFLLLLDACSEPVPLVPSCALMEGAYQDPSLADSANMVLCPDAAVEMVPLDGLCGYRLRWVPNAPSSSLSARCRQEGFAAAEAILVDRGCGIQEELDGAEEDPVFGGHMYACVE